MRIFPPVGLGLAQMISLADKMYLWQIFSSVRNFPPLGLGLDHMIFFYNDSSIRTFCITDIGLRNLIYVYLLS